MTEERYSGSHMDEVQISGFSGIGNWELGIGNWELGIGNWQESKMYLTDTRVAILFEEGRRI